MKFSQFRKHTPTKPSHAYVFICADDLLIEESKPAWERIFGGSWGFEKLSAKEFESIDPARLMEWAVSPPLFGPRRALLVLDAGKVSKKRRQVVDEIARLEDSSLKVVLLSQSRRGLGSAKGAGALPVIEIDAMRQGDTTRWLRDHHSVSEDVARHLVENLGADLSQLQLEIEKLKTYAGERPVEIADIEHLTFRTERFSPFELEDALLDQDYAKSIRVAGAMIEEGFEPVVLLFRVARVWRQILIGKALAGAAPREVAAAASVPEWKAARFSKACQRFDWERIVGGFQFLTATDKALKTTSPNVPVSVDVLLWKLIG